MLRVYIKLQSYNNYFQSYSKVTRPRDDGCLNVGLKADEK